MRCLSRLVFGLVPVLPIMVVVASCSTQEASRIGLVLSAPQGILQDAKTVVLSVFPANLSTCRPDGSVTAVPPKEQGTQVFSLENTGCTGGAAWCKTIELEKDSSAMMFSIVAGDETGPLAQGCATATIDQDPLDVAIKVQVIVPEKCCGDGTFQRGEQCEAPAIAEQCGGIAETDVCTATCETKELQLAVPSDAKPMLPDGPIGKSELAMTFAPGVQNLAGGLRTAYTSTSDDSTEGDVNVRMLDKDVSPITYPESLMRQFRLPHICTEPGGYGSPRSQSSPAIAAVSDILTAIVYVSNETAPTVYNILLSPQQQDGCADIAPFQISAEISSGSAKNERPDVERGPEGYALATWIRGQGAFGRIWKAPVTTMEKGELIPPGAEAEIAIAASAKDVRVAGTKDGWLVVYEGLGKGDDDGIYMVKVDTAGTVGAPMLVNTDTSGVQDHPDIATVPTGEAMVVWRHKGDIYFQRYDAKGAPVGDQFNPLNTITDGEQQHPRVAGSGELNEFFAAAWEEPDGSISARYANTLGGFLPNTVSWQNDAFMASDPTIKGMRRLPAVAIAGHVAIGWHDDDPARPGVFVRRFPLPKH